ncbi:MAG: amidohydrolase family protein [Ilumatobacteraceae bacterium]
MAITETDAPSGDLRFIDSDGHILEPPTALLDYAPAAYQDRIWHIEFGDDGQEWMVFNGHRSIAQGGSGTAGFTDEESQAVWTGHYSKVRPAGWTADLRLDDLDADGIDLSVLYPTRLLGLQGVRDVDFGQVQARAYNDWCCEHLKSGNGRLFGSGALPPMHEADDVSGVAEEIYRVAGMPGMVSVFMRPNPAVEWRPFDDPVYDPIWRALEETGLPIGFHPFLTSDLPGACAGLKLARPRNADGSYVTLEEMDAAEAKSMAETGRFLPNIYFEQALANPVDMMAAVTFITAGGVAERFPGAKFIFLEANGGWLVPYLERLDHHAEKYSWDVPWLTMRPSEYFRRQCWISFDPDESFLEVTATSPLVGADRIIWASDFPHHDAKFPGTTDALREVMAGLTADQQRAIAGESALQLYGIG